MLGVLAVAGVGIFMQNRENFVCLLSSMKKLKLVVCGSLAFFLGTSIWSAANEIPTSTEDHAFAVPQMAVDVAPFVCFGVSASCFAASRFSAEEEVG
jgi:hypothetical protein